MALRVDIVSDVVCPWCVIGYRQLARAAERAGVEIDVRWHPFELNPNLGDGGQDLGEHLAEKYGTTPAASRQARERIATLGRDVGFEFSFSDDMRIVPTFRAHQLLRWAAEHGREHALKQALFARYFTDRADVGDPEVLADAAVSVGLDRAQALAVLEDGRHAEAVRAEEQLWRERGIRGVPAMIFNERHLVTGAQGEDNYVQVLKQLAPAG